MFGIGQVKGGMSQKKQLEMGIHIMKCRKCLKLLYEIMAHAKIEIPDEYRIEEVKP
jgi:hypothetical protein